jgi:hypothetical protein
MVRLAVLLLLTPFSPPGQHQGGLFARGDCLNQCWQKGMCITNGTVHERCVCDSFGGVRNTQHFSGVDCSEYSCPMGTAWFDYATATDTAHAEAECSNMGECIRGDGTCSCNTGFHGASCQRTICPGDLGNGTVCNGHGRCLTVEEMGTFRDDITLTSSVTYTGWDANMITGCLCDDGYGSYDCLTRTCPTGDDPHTTGQVDEVQTVTCTCTDTCSGSFVLKFRDKSTANIPWDATIVWLKAELEQLSTITQVTVSMSGSSTGAVCDADGVTTTITFTKNPGELTAPSALAPVQVSAQLLTAVSSATSALGSTPGNLPTIGELTAPSAV